MTLTHEETSETSQTTNITGDTYLKQTDGKESYATAYLSDRREPRSTKGITGRTTSRQHCQATLSHVTAASTSFVTRCETSRQPPQPSPTTFPHHFQAHYTTSSLSRNSSPDEQQNGLAQGKGYTPHLILSRAPTRRTALSPWPNGPITDHWNCDFVDLRRVV